MKSKKQKKIKYELPVIIEKDQTGYYFAKVPTLKGCHTQAKALPELYKRLNEVIQLCLETAEKDDQELLSSYEFVGFQKIEVFNRSKVKYA